MRRWHQHLIHYLDNKRLLGQHRECCALRGKGWGGKKHSVVDYVFKYDLAHLYAYHMIVMAEMIARLYNVDAKWYSRRYRGKEIGYVPMYDIGIFIYDPYKDDSKNFNCIYVEHNDDYLKECVLNLKAKNAKLINGKTIKQLLIKFDLNN